MPAKKILIATPAHGYTVTTVYHETIVQLLKHFSKRPGISFDTKYVSVAVISVARNFLASYFLERAEYTHLLFIDADMGFHPKLIEKMLALNAPIVGTFYPSRSSNISRMYETSRKTDNAKLAHNLSQSFIGDRAWIVPDTAKESGKNNFQAKMIDGFVQVRLCGTGVMLIARVALQQIKERYPDLWVSESDPVYRGLGLTGGVLQCFESMKDTSGIFVGEDIAFCRRWVEGCGGAIWANISEDVTHLGTFANTGNFMAQLSHPSDGK